MGIEFKNEQGGISVSSKFISEIAANVAESCYGVVGMVSKNATEGFWELMRIENLSKGVNLSFNDEDKLVIELFIMVEYGTKISVIANNIIQKVRYSVEDYTGLKVASVTVNVQAVRV